MQVQLTLTGSMEYTTREGKSKDGNSYKFGTLQYMGGSIRIGEKAMGTVPAGSKGGTAVLMGELRPADYGIGVEVLNFVSLK